MDKNFAAIILAAGEGTRMKSAIPKVMHPLCGRPMLAYVLDLAKEMKLKSTLVVVGHKREMLQGLLADYNAKPVYQDNLLGTADAVKRTESALRNFFGNIIVLYGDQPLLQKETLQRLIQKHNQTSAAATILSAYMSNPSGYGRIIRDNYGSLKAIIEEKDATDNQRNISEINTGIICFKKQLLFKAIARVKPNNAKKEYYLTDCIKLMAEEGLRVESMALQGDVREAQGINTQIDLAQAQRIMRYRILEKFMLQGVGIVDPETTYIDFGATVGQDTIIYPFTVIEKDVKIGNFCSLGPFCHLRPATVIEDRTVIGNYTEISRSHLGKDVFMKHFSYLGDTAVGKNVNIGCGTVVANFDGKNKQKTIIGDGAFIGCDTVLRAPVEIGKYAITGAGAVVTRDVHEGEVVVGIPAKELQYTRRRRKK